MIAAMIVSSGKNSVFQTLMDAVHGTNLTGVKESVSKGANVNQTSRFGDTPIEQALAVVSNLANAEDPELIGESIEEAKAIVRYLLQSGAKLSF